MQRQHSPLADDNMSLPHHRIEPAARAPRGVSAPQRQSTSSPEASLPSCWRLDDASLQQNDPLCILMSASSRNTVYANRPVPWSLLTDSSSSRRSQSGSASELYPHLLDHDASGLHAATNVYYFEVTVLSLQPNAVVDVALGLICEEPGASTAWPGELPKSVGWGTGGLLINGQSFETNPNSARFRNEDVLGCGIEVGGLNRTFFTRNGTMVVPPSPSTCLPHASQMGCYPVVSFRHGSGGRLMGNFGIDHASPFVWTGTDKLKVISRQRGRSTYTRSLDSLPLSPDRDPAFMFRSAGDLSSRSRSRSPSPYYSLSELDQLSDSPTQTNRSASRRPPAVFRYKEHKEKSSRRRSG